MAVGSLVRVLAWQVHLRHDLAHDALVLQDALVGEQSESPTFRVIHNTPARSFLVFHFARRSAVLLELFPHGNVVAGVDSEILVLLGSTQQRAVDQELPVNEPKDADLWFRDLCRSLALSSFRGFLQRLILTADSSDLERIFCAGTLSQSSCNLPRYLATRPDADWIAFAALPSSFSTRSISANVCRTSAARTAFFSRKSVPSILMRSKRGRSTSRSRGNHCRVVRKIQ